MTDLTRRFASVQTQEDGSQNLVLGDAVESRGFPAHTVRASHIINSLPPPDDDLSEFYTGLTTSLSNRYLAASSTLFDRTEAGTMNLFNNSIYSMTDGSRLCVVNQQNFYGLNRQNTHSPQYERFIAEQANMGVDPDVLASDTFQVVTDPQFAPDTAQFVGPVWSEADTFFLGYTLNIGSRLEGLNWLGRDNFVLEFDVNGRIRSYNANNFSAPRRTADPFGVRTTAAGASVVFYRDSELEVRIHPPGRRPPPNFRPVVSVTADFVAGYAPLA